MITIIRGAAKAAQALLRSTGAKRVAEEAVKAAARAVAEKALKGTWEDDTRRG